MATPLCLHSSPRHQPKPSTPSTPSTPKIDFFRCPRPFFLVNWSYTSNNVRCPWQAPPVFFSSLLLISEPIFLLPLLRQLFLYHLPILHTHCYYYIDFQCFVFSLSFLFETVKKEYPFFRPCLLK